MTSRRRLGGDVIVHGRIPNCSAQQGLVQDDRRAVGVHAQHGVALHVQQPLGMEDGPAQQDWRDPQRGRGQRRDQPVARRAQQRVEQPADLVVS